MMLERGPDRVSPFAIPLSVANMGAGPGVDRAGPARPGDRGVHGVRRRHRRHRRGHRHHPPRRRARDARRRRRGADRPRTSWPASTPCGCSRTATTTPPARRGPSTWTATASWWARPARCWCWSAWRTRGRAARGSSARSPATGRAPTPTTSPTPTRARLPQARAVRAALADAGLRPEDVDHVNAHGGASQPGDPAEVQDAAARAGRGGRRAGRRERDQVDARPLHGGDRAPWRRPSPRSP